MAQIDNRHDHTPVVEQPYNIVRNMVNLSEKDSRDNFSNLRTIKSIKIIPNIEE
jgi:hypothetical protein